MLWRFENTGPAAGVFNMKRDEELALALCNGTGQPTLRIYTWQPWAISIGWHQSLDDINIEKARNDGYDVVRRPTGGRAIFHAEEVTYAVVFEVQHQTIQDVYARISQALLHTLSLLGVDATFEKQQPHFPSLYRSVAGASCFSSTGRYEITVDGKKLIGSAQRRYSTPEGKEVVLQHGSLLVGTAHRNLVTYLTVPEAARNHIRLALETKTTELSTVLNRKIQIEEIADAMRRGFEEAWNIQFALPNDEPYTKKGAL